MTQDGVQTLAFETLTALRAVSDPEDELLVVHSSLPLVGLDPARGRWDLLRAIRDLARDGIKLACPTSSGAS